MLKPLPFSLNVPITVCDVKLNVHITELLRASGRECVSLPHNHGDWELRYLTGGNANQIIDGEEYKLTAGDLILLQPSETHYQTENAVTPNLVQYSIRIAIKNPEEPSSQRLNELLSGTFMIRDDKFVLASLFNKLWKEIIYRRPGFFNYIQSLCQSILIEYLRLTGEDCSIIFNVDDSKYTSYWHDRLDLFLHKRFMEDVKLEDLAAEINLSPRHASRMVKREYGISFIAKLTAIRLDNAKYMLRHTKRDLLTISAASGFSSYSYFISCFKKNLGITPGEYRSLQKSK